MVFFLTDPRRALIEISSFLIGRQPMDHRRVFEHDEKGPGKGRNAAV